MIYKNKAQGLIIWKTIPYALAEEFGTYYYSIKTKQKNLQYRNKQDLDY